MRYSTLIFTLAVTASIAHADQELIFDADSLAVRTLQNAGYFSSANYLSKSRSVKLDELWGKILPNASRPTPAREQPWEDLPKIFTGNSRKAFNRRGDEKPRRDFKNSHTQGLVAQVEWKPVRGNGFSGIYESGSDTVIMRLSDVNFLFDEAVGHTPSVALKFLVDGIESQNIFAQYNLLPGESWNFFHETISSRIFRTGQDEEETNDTTDILMETIVPKMTEGSSRPFAIGVSNIAETNNNGSKITNRRNVRTPYELQFVGAQNKFRDFFPDEKENRRPWYESIQKVIKEGDVIYNVIAYEPEHDNNRNGPTETKIAEIVLKTDLYTSTWADESLFFRHKDVNLDRKFWSRGLKRLGEDFVFSRRDDIWGTEVNDFWPTNRVAAKETFMDQMEEYDCPFAWLIGMF